MIALPLLLEAMAAYEAEFENGATVGVEKSTCTCGHHVSMRPVEDGGRGPKELTGSSISFVISRTRC